MDCFGAEDTRWNVVSMLLRMRVLRNRQSHISKLCWEPRRGAGQRGVETLFSLSSLIILTLPASGCHNLDPRRILSFLSLT